MRLEIRGEGRVCAGDIATSADFEIVNPELHLATLDSEDAALSVEFNVDHGKGYQPVPQGGDGIGGPLMGVLPIDAIYNPVRKVNYSVERTRVGHVTDYERLVLEVWTDGTIGPVEALRKSSDALVSHFYRFKDLGKELGSGPDRPTISVPPEVYQTPIEKLELSPRTLNCLKRAHITKVGHVLEVSNSELLKVRNFGEKSLIELMDRLREEGMLSADELAARMGHSVEGAEDAGYLDGPGEDGAADLAAAETADGQPAPEGVITQDFIRAAQEALGRVSADESDVIPQFDTNEAPIFPEGDAREEEDDVDEEDGEE
jgi:DNA-directed RNA polymerase subunit alpha